MLDSELEKVQSLIDEGQYDEAVAALGSPTEEDAEWHFLRGRTLELTGDHAGAMDRYQQALEVDPHHPAALFHLAYLLDLHGEDEQALTLYERAAAAAHTNVNVLINLAVLYEDHGRYSEALGVLERVLKARPNHTRAKLYRMDVVSSMEMYYDEDQERVRAHHSAMLDVPVTDFELSVRSRNCLQKMNIFTLGDLLRTTEATLMDYKNFGETSLDEIKAMLDQKGLHLGQLHEEPKAVASAPEAPSPPPVQGDPLLLSKPVTELQFSVRSRKCLQRLGIATLGDLASKSEAELLGAKNFGQTSLNEIKQRLEENGLSFRKV